MANGVEDEADITVEPTKSKSAFRASTFFKIDM